MKLSEYLHDAVDDVTADLDALTNDARHDGLRQQRRRQVVGVVGASAAVAAIVGGTFLLQLGTEAPPKDDTSPSVAAAPDDLPDDLSGETAPATGRMTAAALMAAVDEVADGTFANFAGQDSRGNPPPYDAGVDAFGEFEFTPTDGGAGEVQVNVQPIEILYGNDDLPPAESKCRKWMHVCSVSTLPNGDILRTWRDDLQGIRLVAEVLSEARGLRVVASATNGFDLGDEWDATRPDAVLSTEQLTDVVSQPWWGLELPEEFVEPGDNLAGYEQLRNYMVLD